MTENQLLKKAIQTLGLETQLNKAAEEASELSSAINKFLYITSIEKGHKLNLNQLVIKENAIANMVEELVDVEIMCKQLHIIIPDIRPRTKEIFNIDYADYKAEKLKKLSEFIKIVDQNKIKEIK